MRSAAGRLALLITAIALSASPCALAHDKENKQPGGDTRPSAERAQAEGISFADTVFWAPEILVEADRLHSSDRLFDRSGFVAAIELDRAHTRIDDAATLLSRLAGVRVLQYGGLGSFATVSIRGSSSSQVHFYLDGVPLNNAYLGAVNLGDLPLGDVNRIEIYRGFSPPHLGSSAIGGAINLVSFAGEDSDRTGPELTMSAAAGSFGTGRYLLSLSSGAARVRLRGHVSYLKSNGDFSFTDDRNTPLNPLDDQITTRLNNDFSLWNLLGRIESDLPAFDRVSLSHNALLREGGVPGLGSNQSLTARSERATHITYLKLDPKPFLEQAFRTGFTAYHSLTADRFSDPDGDITALRQKTDNRMTVYGANGRVGIDPAKISASFELFFEGRKERFHQVSLLPEPSEGPDRMRSVQTLSVSSDIQPAGERFVMTVGGRFEWHENDFYDEPPFPWLPPTPQGKVKGYEGTPHAGFRYHVIDWLCIKGNWGRYYRLPTFLELFGDLGSVTGNPDLEPERGTNRDIGVILKGKRLYFMRQPYAELVYIDNAAENLILFFPNSQYTSAPVNIGSASIKGLESSFSFSLPRSIRLSGSYTYLDHRDTGPIPYYNGNRLAAQPVHQALGRIEIVRTHWRIEYELDYIGANYLDQANMIKVPAREIHNLLLEFSLPRRGFTISLEGRNLGNNQISDVNGFPLPGRSLYSTVSITM